MAELTPPATQLHYPLGSLSASAAPPGVSAAPEKVTIDLPLVLGHEHTKLGFVACHAAVAIAIVIEPLAKGPVPRWRGSVACAC